MTVAFMPSLRDEWSQGDVVEWAPFGSVPSAVRLVREYDSDSEKDVRRAKTYPYPLTGEAPTSRPKPFHGNGDFESIELRARICRAVLISNDCTVIDKAKNRESKQVLPWHVAPIQKWPTDPKVAQAVTERRVLRYMEIPAAPGVERGVLDFMYLTPVHPDLLQGITRVASLADEGVGELWARLFAFFSGQSLHEFVEAELLRRGGS